MSGNCIFGGNPGLHRLQTAKEWACEVSAEVSAMCASVPDLRTIWDEDRPVALQGRTPDQGTLTIGISSDDRLHVISIAVTDGVVIPTRIEIPLPSHLAWSGANIHQRGILS